MMNAPYRIPLALLAVLVVGGCGPQFSTADFAECLADNGAKAYGASWCDHCDAQKELFGDAWSSIDYVECGMPGSDSELTQVCVDAGIQGLPTWKFGDGSTRVGRQSLLELSQASGCPLQGGPTRRSENAIIFVGPQQRLDAVVGKQFAYSFCKPDVESPAATCGGLEGATTDPTGGTAPYSFEARGILPPGLALNLNGLLAGTPTLEGTYTSQVCAKDAQTNQGCTDITVVVKKPEIEHGFSVGSITCNVINREIASEGGPKYDVYTFDIRLSGTVTGPVDAVFSVHSNTVGLSDNYFVEGLTREYNQKPAYIKAAAWSGILEYPESRLIRIQRTEGDPSTTNWESGGFITVGQGVGGWPMPVQMLVTFYDDSEFSNLLGRDTPTVLCSP